MKTVILYIWSNNSLWVARHQMPIEFTAFWKYVTMPTCEGQLGKIVDFRFRSNGWLLHVTPPHLTSLLSTFSPYT